LFPIIKKRRLERLLLVLSEVVVGIVSNLVVFKVLYVFFGNSICVFVIVVLSVAMHVLLISVAKSINWATAIKLVCS